MGLLAQQGWSLCREKTSSAGQQSEGNIWMLHNTSQWRALRLADTWTKVEEVKGHWKEDQRRLAFLGRQPGGWRVEEVWGRDFFLCLLILCLLKLASDFSGEDAQCFLVLSTAMTTLTCMCSGAKLVPTKLHLLPAHRPLKKPADN